jgi:hypothetical protein
MFMINISMLDTDQNTNHHDALEESIDIALALIAII